MLSFSDISELTILERVDEYSLYCFYLGYEPVIGAKTNSTLRTVDDKASFGVFERKKGNPEDPHEFLWKDAGLPAPNFGDIFDLVRILYSLTRWEALIKVAEDFGLIEGSTKASKTLIIVPVRKPPCQISFKARPFTQADLEYWSSYFITLETLEHFKVQAVSFYKLYPDTQETFHARGKMYAYKIQGRYQLYQPNPKKFFMDWTDSCVPGFEQLRGKEVCIITKSYKDVMLLWQLGFDVVASKAENNYPNPLFLDWLKWKYKGKVFTLFDNDLKTSEHLYPFAATHIPTDSGEKDPTDFAKKYGVETLLKLLKRMQEDFLLLESQLMSKFQRVSISFLNSGKLETIWLERLCIEYSMTVEPQIILFTHSKRYELPLDIFLKTVNVIT
jgi:hypothetical protein